MVPTQREIAKKYKDIQLNEIDQLLQSEIHEQRLTALLLLTIKCKKATTEKHKAIYEYYLKNTKQINNWDLVDLSAPQVVGTYLLDKDRTPLYKLANDSHLWKKRIAIISTFTFIKNNQFDDTLAIAEILLQDKHDLIQKAVGWMLREISKRDLTPLLNFLDRNTTKMPRTMLRYAIEKLDPEKKSHYMKLK